MTIARLLSVLAVTVLFACHPRPSSPTSVLENAAKAASGTDANARSLALAGFHAWLLEGNADLAKERFDLALQRGSNDPWALYGQITIADRAAQPDHALTAAIGLVERAPTHPLSTTAARRLLSMVGMSSRMNAQIVAAADRALSGGAQGDTAWLLRTAKAQALLISGDDAGLAAAQKDAGINTTFTVLGPFSAFDVLEFDQAIPPEASGAVDGPFTGPMGEVRPRIVSFPDGRFSLASASPRGDVYALAVDLDVPANGDYVVRTVSGSPHKVVLDGTLLHERRAFARAEPNTGASGVKLTEGRHRLVIKVSRARLTGSVALSVTRVDGKPAGITVLAAKGAPASWAGVKTFEPAHTYPDATGLAAALEDEVGAALARYVGIADGMGRDPDGAARMMAELSELLKGSPAVAALRAGVALEDRSAPSRISRGRATRDLEAVLAKDPKHTAALLTRARMALEDGRTPDAREWLTRAREAQKTTPFPVELLQARVDLSSNIDAAVDQTAQAVLKAHPGLCEAVALRYDLARKQDAVALADELVSQLEGCPGSLSRRAEHARMRGRLDEAIALYEELWRRDANQTGSTHGLTSLYVADGRYVDAIRTASTLRETFPHHTDHLRRLADALDFAGRTEDALKVREQLLAIDGGDLSLRRAVHRARTGKEPLQDHAIDGRAAIARYEASSRPEEGAYVYVLDAATVEVFPDGSMVDRIHQIQKATSQDGTSEIGEVRVPEGAQILELRTIKQDGTVLEPETIEHKDTISMPGVEVGDYVEFEFLQAHAARGPAQPGFTASTFYFQIANVANAWATYTVIAPKEMKLIVEARNLKVAAPKIVAEKQIFHHEARDVPPWIVEPHSPPSSDEFLPHVTVGAGATGNDGLVALYADAFADRGKLTWNVEQFAREAARGKEGRTAVEALYAAVMQRLSGRDAGLTGSASYALALDRGSRLWALKASLEAVGIPTRLAAVRTFSADPSEHVLPDSGLLSWVGLVAEVPGGERIWLDTGTRWAPFGEIPESARGREAWLFPEPGRPLEKTTTPAGNESQPKRVTLELTLSEEGVLRGRGTERFSGYEAAGMNEALEGMAPEQRKQALQSALSRFFGGAELEKLELELQPKVGGELVISYEFVAPRFARREGDRLVFGALAYPEMLGRRYVQLGRRDTPLYIGHTEQSVTKVTLKLPPGFKLNGPIGEAKVEDTFGRFVRREKQEGDVLHVEEEFRINMARIPPAQYEKFSHFAGQVDLLQTRDLILEKR